MRWNDCYGHISARCSKLRDEWRGRIDLQAATIVALDRLLGHYFPAAIALAKGVRFGFVGLTTTVDTRTHTSLDPGLAVASPLAEAVYK